MMQVVAFTGGQSVPSARFRVRQYIPALRREGVNVAEFASLFGQYPPRSRWGRPLWALALLTERLADIARLGRCDAVLLQREILSTFVTVEPLIKRPKVLDVDDAIFLNRGGKAAKKLSEVADKVICGNNFLAEWFRRWNRNVDVIATAIDTEQYRPADAAGKRGGSVAIGWIGTSANHTYLIGIEGVLAKVMRSHLEARLVVISDRAPEFRQLPSGRVDYIPWSEDAEVSDIQAIDIGLMPLDDSLWARGKCSFKMLQYMAVGLPVVVSPVGMNAEVLELGEIGIGAKSESQWVDGLSALLESERLRFKMGVEGRRVVESKFSIQALAPTLARSLRGI